jgi:hypothetical protein
VEGQKGDAFGPGFRASHRAGSRLGRCRGFNPYRRRELMAMTKAERMETLETELAFRWPTAPEPMPMTGAEINANLEDLVPRDRSVIGSRKAAKGWVHNAYTATVTPAWSSGYTHGRNHTGDGGTQGMGRIYRTEAEAALAMRWEMCRDFAKKLRAVDLLIEGNAA